MASFLTGVLTWADRICYGSCPLIKVSIVVVMIVVLVIADANCDINLQKCSA